MTNNVLAWRPTSPGLSPAWTADDTPESKPLAAARAGHRGRRLVLGVGDVFGIEDADLAVAPDIEVGAALGIGVDVVDAAVLRDRIDRALERFAAGLELGQLAIMLHGPSIALR